jgi:hypothetical protein
MRKTCNTKGERLLVGKPERRRQPGRPRCRRVDNIRMDVGGDRMGWCVLAWVMIVTGGELL